MSIDQQRTVVNEADVELGKFYVHTSCDTESVVWGPYEEYEARGFMAHAGFDRCGDIEAVILLGREVIQKGILK